MGANTKMCIRGLAVVTLAGFAMGLSENSINASPHMDQFGSVNKADDLFAGRAFPVTECSGGRFNAQCLKIHALSILEEINSREEIPIISGLSVVKEKKLDNGGKNPEEIVAELARAFPDQPDERIDRYLVYRLANFVDNHSLRFRLLGDSEESLQKTLNVRESGRKGGGGGGGGGGGKGGGGLGNLMAAGMMMKSTLAAAALGGLALLAGKALMTALISLVVSAILAIASLSHKGGGKTTYEVITKPVVHTSNTHSSSHEDHHGHSGYGRSMTFDLPDHMKGQ